MCSKIGLYPVLTRIESEFESRHTHKNALAPVRFRASLGLLRSHDPQRLGRQKVAPPAWMWCSGSTACSICAVDVIAASRRTQNTADRKDLPERASMGVRPRWRGKVLLKPRVGFKSLYPYECDTCLREWCDSGERSAHGRVAKPVKAHARHA